MNIEEFREYCLNKKGVTEEMPFGENTLVFKVMAKIFTLTDINTFESISLKCDPEKAIELREKYHSVLPGYHLSKKHWNTVLVHGDVNDTELYRLIDHSYDLVVSKLPKKQQEALKDIEV